MSHCLTVVAAIEATPCQSTLTENREYVLRGCEPITCDATVIGTQGGKHRDVADSRISTAGNTKWEAYGSVRAFLCNVYYQSETIVYTCGDDGNFSASKECTGNLEVMCDLKTKLVYVLFVANSCNDIANEIANANYDSCVEAGVVTGDFCVPTCLPGYSSSTPATGFTLHCDSSGFFDGADDTLNCEGIHTLSQHET